MPLKLKETNVSNEHNRHKNPNWRDADQLAMYKHDRGIELGSTKKQLQLVLFTVAKRLHAIIDDDTDNRICQGDPGISGKRYLFRC